MNKILKISQQHLYFDKQQVSRQKHRNWTKPFTTKLNHIYPLLILTLIDLQCIHIEYIYVTLVIYTKKNEHTLYILHLFSSCTVVKEFRVFWTNVVSPKITYSTSCPVSTNSPPTSIMTSSPTAATSSSIYSSLSSDISNITISSSTSSTNGTSTHVPSTNTDFTNSSKSNLDNTFYALFIMPILYTVTCI